MSVCMCVCAEIIFDLPIDFPIINIISLSVHMRVCVCLFVLVCLCVYTQMTKFVTAPGE